EREEHSERSAPPHAAAWGRAIVGDHRTTDSAHRFGVEAGRDRRQRLRVLTVGDESTVLLHGGLHLCRPANGVCESPHRKVYPGRGGLCEEPDASGLFVESLASPT